ncbi:MAG: YdjY domain-containing protein [Planctomycetota bacterium]
MNALLPTLLPTLLCFSASILPCQSDPAPQDPKPTVETPTTAKKTPSGDELLDGMFKSFQEQGITIDAKKFTVSVQAVVNQPQDPIEYLLIHRRGKKHEAVFRCEAKASVLNAALLMIGFEPGKNATYKEKEPAPTLEEVRAGVDPLIITPPKGKPFFMTVRFTSEDGTVRENCVEELLFDLTTQLPLPPCDWVYLGGRMAVLYKGEPEVYMADLEGNLVSVCYLTPDNHLATMVHERARDDQNWWTTTALPEPGTPCEFVFHRNEPKQRADWKKRQARIAADDAVKRAMEAAKEAAEQAKSAQKEGGGGEAEEAGGGR